MYNDKRKEKKNSWMKPVKREKKRRKGDENFYMILIGDHFSVSSLCEMREV